MDLIEVKLIITFDLTNEITTLNCGRNNFIYYVSFFHISRLIFEISEINSFVIWLKANEHVRNK